MRKKILLVLVVFSMLLVVGCSPSTKTFSGSGISIELNGGFIEKEVIQAPIYLESTNHIFMGARELKSEVESMGINNLRQYIEAVLSNSGHTATVELYEEDGVMYYFAYYTATVDREYGYMLFVMQGEHHFYTMNFGCLEKNLESNKTKYHNWAQTVTVE